MFHDGIHCFFLIFLFGLLQLQP